MCAQRFEMGTGANMLSRPLEWRRNQMMGPSIMQLVRGEMKASSCTTERWPYSSKKKNFHDDDRVTKKRVRISCDGALPKKAT